MSYIGVTNKASEVSVGSVSVDPPAAGSLTTVTGETLGPVNIPAGALWIKIRNAGIVQQGDQEKAATIDGQSWSVGREETWEAVFDSAAEEYKRLPAVSINANGSRVFYSYAS